MIKVIESLILDPRREMRILLKQ